MLVSILKTAVKAATTTEKSGIFIKSETAYIAIHEKRTRKKINISYSCDVLLSTMTETISHN